ncbi:MAG: hypothetical protein BA863_12855 [Desulfovibrio sp. S3730MH75]|nr:MAG: hypothetical protein BA863_12855 [Desulfovibrio sp. S3730MH75]
MSTHKNHPAVKTNVVTAQQAVLEAQGKGVCKAPGRVHAALATGGIRPSAPVPNSYLFSSKNSPFQ